jgi:hypothetical protein
MKTFRFGYRDGDDIAWIGNVLAKDPAQALEKLAGSVCVQEGMMAPTMVTVGRAKSMRTKAGERKR